MIEEGAWGRADAIKQAVKARLQDDHGLTHVTLEMECTAHICEAPARIGH